MSKTECQIVTMDFYCLRGTGVNSFFATNLTLPVKGDCDTDKQRWSQRLYMLSISNHSRNGAVRKLTQAFEGKISAAVLANYNYSEITTVVCCAKK